MTRSQNMSTKAFVVDEVGAPFRLQDIVLDELHADEVLVEIKYTGICHTDIVVQHGGLPVGSFPAVLGHEGAGIVRQVGSGVDAGALKPGDAVMLSFRSCQSCQACKSGRWGACPQMTEMNFVRSRRDISARSPYTSPEGKAVHGQFFGQSSFSKMAIVAQQSVTKCDVTLDEMKFLAPLGCGYLTGAGTVLNALKPSQTSKIAILGVGAVGMAAVMAAKVAGAAEIIAVDLFDVKLELARSIGATHTLNTKEFPDFVGKLRETFPDGIDYVLDTTGNAKLLGLSVGLLGHEGTLALVGAPAPGSKFEVDALDMLTACKRIIGVIEGYSNPSKIVPELIQLYRAGKFPVDRIAKIYPADSFHTAIEDLKSGSVIKPIISWE